MIGVGRILLSVDKRVRGGGHFVCFSLMILLEEGVTEPGDWSGLHVTPDWSSVASMV